MNKGQKVIVLHYDTVDYGKVTNPKTKGFVEGGIEVKKENGGTFASNMSDTFYPDNAHNRQAVKALDAARAAYRMQLMSIKKMFKP